MISKASLYSPNRIDVDFSTGSAPPSPQAIPSKWGCRFDNWQSPQVRAALETVQGHLRSETHMDDQQSRNRQSWNTSRYWWAVCLAIQWACQESDFIVCLEAIDEFVKEYMPSRELFHKRSAIAYRFKGSSSDWFDLIYKEYMPTRELFHKQSAIAYRLKGSSGVA